VVRVRSPRRAGAAGSPLSARMRELLQGVMLGCEKDFADAIVSSKFEQAEVCADLAAATREVLIEDLRAEPAC
jgi:hypothetical protein